MEIENLTLFILAQVSAGIALTFAVLSFFTKKHIKLFVFQLISNLFYCLNFILLGAYVGAIMLIIAIIRNFVSLLFVLNKKEIEISEIVIFETMFIIAGAVSFVQTSDILSILANMIFSFGILQKNRIIFLSCQVFASTLATVYNILNLSYVGAGLEIVAVITGIISIAIIIKQAKNKTTANKFDFT